MTGGGTGLGREVSRELARRGCRVAVGYSRSRTDAEATAAEIGGLAVRADVAVEAEVRAALARVREAFGGLDYLVCNAGQTVRIPFPDLEAVTEPDWDRLQAVNVKGPFFCARAAAPLLRQRRGAIVTIASIAGVQPEGSSLPYCVSKAALLHLTRCLARSLAPEVRVNAVSPGLLMTRWQDDASGDWLDRMRSATLLRHEPAVADVAAAVVGVLRNPSITGQNLVVDAGVVLR